MFYSDITARQLIEDIRDEADIAIPIPNRSYLQWLNTAEQLLYSEIIKDVHYAECTLQGGKEFLGPVNLSEFSNLADTERENIDVMRTTDIESVYVFGSSNGQNPQSLVSGRGTELICTSNANAEFFNNSYHWLNNGICVHCKDLKGFNDVVLTVYYYARPKKKLLTEDGDIPEDEVCIPVEWLELIKAYVRGQAYLVANEFTLSGNWLNVYNSLVENFKQYCELRKISGIGLR